MIVSLTSYMYGLNIYIFIGWLGGGGTWHSNFLFSLIVYCTTYKAIKSGDVMVKCIICDIKYLVLFLKLHSFPDNNTFWFLFMKLRQKGIYQESGGDSPLGGGGGNFIPDMMGSC